MLITKLCRDRVVTLCNSGKGLVGVYLKDDPENILLECSPEKADALIKIWNKGA